MRPQHTLIPCPNFVPREPLALQTPLQPEKCHLYLAQHITLCSMQAAHPFRHKFGNAKLACDRGRHYHRQRHPHQEESNCSPVTCCEKYILPRQELLLKSFHCIEILGVYGQLSVLSLGTDSKHRTLNSPS